jgi:uncharacterized protein DUF5395
MTKVDVELRYEHDRWHARGPGIEVVHAELRGIETQLAARLATDRTPLDVQLRFAVSALPRWLMQYHGHYCNYVLHVPPRGARA